MVDRDILDRIDRRTETTAERIADIQEEFGSVVKDVTALKAEQEHIKNQVNRNTLAIGQVTELSARMTNIDARLTNVEDSNRMHRKALEEWKEKKIAELEQQQHDTELAEADAKKWKIRTAVGVMLTVLTSVAAWLWKKYGW